MILAYSEALTIGAGAIPPDAARTTDQETVEVTIIPAGMGLVNRLNDGLRVRKD